MRKSNNPWKFNTKCPGIENDSHGKIKLSNIVSVIAIRAMNCNFDFLSK